MSTETASAFEAERMNIRVQAHAAPADVRMRLGQASSRPGCLGCNASDDGGSVATFTLEDEDAQPS
jgi:hypothetical protein